MTLPAALTGYLDNLAQAFGGLAAVTEYVSEVDLGYLATFPGFIYVVKPWAPVIELTDHGYEPGSVYSLSDRNYNLLYAGKSVTGSFGQTQVDVDFLLTQRHGALLHIAYQSLQGPVIGLLWVCARLNQQQVRQQISLWQAQAVQGTQQLTTHELYLRTDQLLSTDTIGVTFAPGHWSSPLTPDAIRSHPDAVTVSQPQTAGLITIYPQQSGWYLFEVLRQGQRLPLELTQFLGVGAQRLRQAATSAYYLQLQNQTAGLLAPKNLNLTTATSTPTRAEKLRLEAVLQEPPATNLTGDSLSQATPYTQVAGLLTLAVLSQAKAVGRYNPSLQATVVAKAYVGRILANGTDRLLVNPSQSEPLLLKGRATVDCTIYVQAQPLGAFVRGIATVNAVAIVKAASQATAVSQAVATVRIDTSASTLQFYQPYITDTLAASHNFHAGVALDPIEFTTLNPATVPLWRLGLDATADVFSRTLAISQARAVINN